MLGCQGCWAAWMLACWGIELQGYSDAQRLEAEVLRCWHDRMWSCCRDSDVQGCWFAGVLGYMGAGVLACHGNGVQDCTSAGILGWIAWLHSCLEAVVSGCVGPIVRGRRVGAVLDWVVASLWCFSAAVSVPSSFATASQAFLLPCAAWEPGLLLKWLSFRSPCRAWASHL